MVNACPKSEVQDPGISPPRSGVRHSYPGLRTSHLGRVAPGPNARDLPPMADVATFEAEVLPRLDTMYRVARRLTGETADAEDLVQEALLRAWRGWAGFTPGSNVRAWLLTIVRNAFISKWRTRRHE